jgi:GLPGLI family protein
MKKITVLIFSLFLQNLLLAQTNNSENYGLVTYERILNFDNKPESTIFSLFFNPNSSVFYENRKEIIEETTMKPITDDEFDLSFEVKFNGSKYIVLTDFEKDSIQSQVSLFSEGKQQTYIVQEKINNIKWTILSEFSTINDFKTQKAIGEFRGRKFNVWFTNQIPVKYGPWKLNGLPGLILEVSDERNEVMFYAKSIKIPFNINSKSKSDFEFNSDFEKISLTNYLNLKQEQVNEVKNLFISKLPRGAKMEISNIKSNSIELEYEKLIKN